MIGPIEMREMVAMWVGASGSDEDGGNARVGVEVEGEGVAEGDYWRSIGWEGEVG